jgi:putative ABC transport system permease protein
MPLDRFLQDAAYGFRTLRKTPGFTLVAVLMLALGIGANTAIFTAVYHVMLRPLPYANPARLMALWEDFSFIGFPHNNFCPADYVDWKKQNTVFEDIAAFRGTAANLTADGAPESVRGRAVTPNFFPLLGVAPLLGRTFTEEEDRRHMPVVVLSYTLWQSRYAGDVRIVGRAILMNGAKFTVIGVMPKTFVFPARSNTFWTPIYFTPRDLANRGGHFLDVIARLKPGVSLAQARAETTQIARRLERAYPASNSRVGAVVLPLRDDMVGDTRLALLILIAASGLVLLIAASNLANLLLARATGRSREMAIRAALGAGFGRLIQQVVMEALMLSAAGAALGLIVAEWSLGVLEKLVPGTLPATLALDGRVVLFTAAIAIATGLLFGAAPAFQSAMVQLNSVLKQGGGRAGASTRSRRLRDALVVSEVALALVLLVAAGLMLRTLAHLGSEDPGFQPDRLLTLRTILPRVKYEQDAQRMAYYSTVLDRIRALPGVAGAGFSSDLPFEAIGDTDSFRVEGRPRQANNVDLDALYREATNGYLQTIGARLLEGRFFNDYDGPNSQPAVIINQTFAKAFWTNQSPIGRRVQVGDEKQPWRTIVGVVADIRERGLLLPMKPAVYLSDYQVHHPESDDLAIRAAGPSDSDPLALVNAVRQVIWSVDPEQPVSDVGTMRELMERETSSRREAMILLSAFAGPALLLAALGIYGVLSYAVTQRTQEMGIRIALGAERARLIGMIVRQGVAVAAIGVGIGVAAALVLTRALQGLLYGVTATDPLTFGAMPVLVMLIAALACYVPARRAAALDPLLALRYE